jgi:hypothetical protein
VADTTVERVGSGDAECGMREWHARGRHLPWPLRRVDNFLGFAILGCLLGTTPSPLTPPPVLLATVAPEAIRPPVRRKIARLRAIQEVYAVSTTHSRAPPAP